jgi:hypothetical protein
MLTRAIRISKRVVRLTGLACCDETGRAQETLRDSLDAKYDQIERLEAGIRAKVNTRSASSPAVRLYVDPISWFDEKRRPDHHAVCLWVICGWRVELCSKLETRGQ